MFAASSLTDVFQDMATAFQQANPNAKLTFNFGASSQLATQLGQDARADVFASADQTQMDNAKKAGAVAGQDQVFARNRLVLITPKDNPAHISTVKDLANNGVKFVTARKRRSCSSAPSEEAGGEGRSKSGSRRARYCHLFRTAERTDSGDNT